MLTISNGLDSSTHCSTLILALLRLWRLTLKTLKNERSRSHGYLKDSFVRFHIEWLVSLAIWTILQIKTTQRNSSLIVHKLFLNLIYFKFQSIRHITFLIKLCSTQSSMFIQSFWMNMPKFILNLICRNCCLSSCFLCSHFSQKSSLNLSQIIKNTFKKNSKRINQSISRELQLIYWLICSNIEKILIKKEKETILLNF